MAHSFSFRKRKHFTNQQKSAITQAHKRVFENQNFFLKEIRSAKKNNRTPLVQVKKLKKGQHKLIKNFAGGNLNKKALFVKTPTAQKKSTVRILKNGNVTIRTGITRQIYVAVDPLDFLEDADKAIRDAIRGNPKPDSINFIYDGFLSKEAKTVEDFIIDLERYTQDMDEQGLDETFQLKRVTGLALNYVKQ